MDPNAIDRVRVVRGLAARLEHGEPLDALVTGDFELVDDVGGALFPNPLVGHSLDERRRSLDASVASWFVELRDVVEAPDGRVVAVLVSGQSAFAQLGAAVFDFHDGLIRRLTAFKTPDDALRFAGLEPPS